MDLTRIALTRSHGPSKTLLFRPTYSGLLDPFQMWSTEQTESALGSVCNTVCMLRLPRGDDTTQGNGVPCSTVLPTSVADLREAPVNDEQLDTA